MSKLPAFDKLPLGVRVVWSGQAQALGLDPSDYWDWMSGREKAPEWFADRAVRTHWPALPPTFFGSPLPSDTDGATIDTPMQTESTRIFRRGPAPTRTKWVTALKTRGMSIGGWAAGHKVAYSTARSWVQKKGGGRSIPLRWAEVIATEFPEVPAVDESWPNGIQK